MYCLCTSSKDVSHYDLSVMCLKKMLDKGWVGGCQLYLFLIF